MPLPPRTHPTNPHPDPPGSPNPNTTGFSLSSIPSHIQLERSLNSQTEISFWSFTVPLFFPCPCPTRSVTAYCSIGIKPNRRRERQESPCPPLTSIKCWFGLRSLRSLRASGNFLFGNFSFRSLGQGDSCRSSLRQYVGRWD